MNTLTIYIYTLQTLASVEGVKPDYLLVLIHRLRKANKPLEWRGYKFVKVGSDKADDKTKPWLAFPKDCDIELR